MKSKLYPYLLVVLLVVITVWLTNRATNSSSPAKENSKSKKERRKTGFDRKIADLEYTVHAKCRMRCRRITQAEVEDILENGIINYKKSDLSDKPCPTYALEGYTFQDKQHVRIVFAQCLQKTKVVTCIDLESELTCNCR